MIGCDGIWEGGDYHDDQDVDKIEGQNVVNFVGNQLNKELRKTGDEREINLKEASQTVI